MTREKESPVRLLLVDDSATVRSVVRYLLEKEGGIEVVGEACDGCEAVEKASSLRPDAILMDITMPRMDGLSATGHIMATCPAPIVAFSSLTWSGEARASIDMLAAGALDVLGKPDLADARAAEECARLLRRKIRIASKVAVVRHLKSRIAAPLSRPTVPGVPEGVAVGASTGGPAALRDLLGRLSPSCPFPVLVVQHITHGFTDGFVEWLGQQIRLPVRVAAETDRAEAGRVLIAPEGRQMEVRADGTVRCVSRSPRGVHIPSVDVLFESAAQAWGGRGMGILLTGMGADGAQGLLAMKRAGASTAAQDEGSCVVFGMPAEAARIGAVSLLLPPGELGDLLRKAEKAGSGLG